MSEVCHLVWPYWQWGARRSWNMVSTLFNALSAIGIKKKKEGVMITLLVMGVSSLALLYGALLIAGVVNLPQLPRLVIRTQDNLLDRDVQSRLRGLAEYEKEE